MSDKPVRISDELAALIERSITKHAPGEGVAYDVGMMMLPTGPQSAQVALIVTLTIPSLVIGQRVQTASIMPGVHPTEEQLDELVVASVRALKDTRAQEAAKTNGQPHGLTWDDMEAKGDWDSALGEGQ
jgi:hypothetical protein